MAVAARGLSRKQTSIGRRRKVGFLDLIPKSLRTNQSAGLFYVSSDPGFHAEGTGLYCLRSLPQIFTYW
jgi:hypothetical protein